VNGPKSQSAESAHLFIDVAPDHVWNRQTFAAGFGPKRPDHVACQGDVIV